MDLYRNRILIVDDFKDGRDLIECALSQKGFSVTAAKDGQEALEKVLETQPDLVIMDLSLPGISGWEVTRRLKADDRTRQIPILILTADDLFNAKTALGCEGFLVKPCLPDTMVAEIVRILGTRAPGGVSSATA